MSITKEARDGMVAALKAGNKAERQVYSSIVNALDNKAKELRVSELSPEDEIQVITKLMKQNQESISTCPESRTDILDTLNFEKSIISKFMPKQMDEAEIKQMIEGVLSTLSIDAPTNKDKGKIMKELMPKVKGKADGKLVNSILATYMKG